VLIVDDEPIARLGMRSLVDWKRYGLTYAGEAGDGVEAWEKLQRENIDILVTDILMPRMDGLELIRRLRSMTDEIGVLVLSCLDDFEYVKEAMKLGAEDYILKPTMEPEQLVSNILEIGRKLEQRRVAREQITRWKRQAEETKQVQLAMRIRTFAERGTADSQLENDLFAGNRNLYSLMVYGEVEPPVTDWNVPDLVAEARWHDRILLLFSLECGASRHDRFMSGFAKAREVDAFILKHIGEEATEYYIALGPFMRSLSDLQSALKLHERQIDYQFYHPSGKIVGEVPHRKAEEAPLPYECRNDLLRAVFHDNREAVLYGAEQLVRRIRETQPAVSKLRPFVYETVGLIAGYARERGYARMDEYERRYVSMEAVQRCWNVGSLCKWLAGALRELWEYRTGPAFDTLPANPFIRKALDFMKENYRRNLSTVDIANHVRLSRSYLSDLYSREMGESLSETLMRLRVNEAKRMLRAGDMKIYEIAEAVGFSDPKVFAKAFKKVVGCTPKEFELSNK